MSKTYIVETDDETQLIVEIGVNSTGAALIATNPVSFLTPYTEPDVQQVREDAFKNGYDAACKDIDIKSKINAAYQKGLNDAWDAAKKIVLSREDGGLFEYDTRKAVFGCGNYMALKKYSASEAIEKIRQYEQDRPARIEYNFDEIKDVIETTAKEYNMSLDEIAKVLQKMMVRE